MKFKRLRNILGRPFDNDVPADQKLYNKIRREALIKFNGDILKETAQAWIEARYRKLGGLFKFHGSTKKD